MKEALCTHLTQVGILVKDMEKAVEFYENILGVGPWKKMTMSTDVELFHDLKINGKEYPPHTDVLKIAMLHRFGIEFELIEPVAESIFKDWVEEHGNGLHHIAVVTKGDVNDLIRDYKELTGRELWVTGEASGGEVNFAYLDLRDETGLIVEVYKEKNLSGKPAIPYEMESILE